MVLYFTVNSSYVMFNILLFGKLISTSLRVIMLVLISRVKLQKWEYNNVCVSTLQAHNSWKIKVKWEPELATWEYGFYEVMNI